LGYFLKQLFTLGRISDSGRIDSPQNVFLQLVTKTFAQKEEAKR
jgi:hypothetical protein